MKKIAIVGLGTITKHYLAGLTYSPVFELCAVCDLLQNPTALDLYSNIPFYNDYKDMIEKAAPDYIIISTEPATHFNIAEYALKNNVNVIVEKPAVLKMGEYDRLLNLAEQNGLTFHVAFHWQNGEEIKVFLDNYNPELISEISVSVLDPYSSDGSSIDENKIKLMGAWVDSGVNILSMLRMMLPFETVSVENLDIKKCINSGLPIYVQAILKIDGRLVRILIDWRQHTDYKCTEVVYEGRKIIINNSLQKIEDGEKVIDCFKMPRLACHYYNFFVGYNGTQDIDAARDIHRVLLEVVEKYEKINS